MACADEGCVMIEEKIFAKIDNPEGHTLVLEQRVIEICGNTVRIFESGDEFQNYLNGGINIWMNEAHDIEMKAGGTK